MRFTLPLLLSVVGSAMASHQVCFFQHGGAHHNVILKAGPPDVILMDQGGDFGFFDRHLTFKNSRGRFDTGVGSNEWSAAMDGYDWGKFQYQSVRNIGDGRFIKFGCYDTSNNGYCNDAAANTMWQACLRRHGQS
ncbi:MAG: hypothetical protein BYD32DRAFT_409556 [Podila humilis]|nr:MAG: hypothetical protein BYD32DRAFT_409556 [Podila humilis]